MTLRARARTLVIAMLALTLIAPVQATAAATPWSGSISGVVRHADGTPAAGASVWASPVGVSGFSTRASTGADGAFRVDRLTPGEYTLELWSPRRAEYRGWRTSNSSVSHERSDAATIHVGLGASVGGIDAGFRIGGTISGTVSATDGSAVPSPRVTAYRRTVGSTGTQWTWAAGDDESPFTLEGLPPGQYVVSFAARRSTGPAPTYMFWNGATTPSAAKVVTVTDGSSLTMSSRLGRGARVSGSLRMQSGAPVVGAYVTAQRVWSDEERSFSLELGQDYGAFSARTDANGAFTITGLPEGAYRFTSSHNGASGWWPAAPDRDSARVLQVAHESATAGLDMTIARPIKPGIVTVSGRLRTGSTLTADPGTWAAGVRLQYQWFTSDEWDHPGQAVAGATGSTLTLTNAQAARYLRVRVTGSFPDSRTVTVVGSPATDVRSVGVLAPPAPRVLGTPKVDAPLTAARGALIPGATYSYRWYADGKPIPSATTKVWHPESKHAGKRISVKVTYRKDGYETVSRATARTAKVLRVFGSAEPFIGGFISERRRADLYSPNWGSGVSHSYQWYADGKPIRGATRKSFTPSAKYVGKRLSATVTLRKAGYATQTFATKRTPRVTRWHQV